MRTLHIHLDESGDFNFSAAGSKYYIFSCAWTYDPAPMEYELTALRFSLVKQGYGERLSGFHACEDAQPRREKVLEILARYTNWNFASIVITKRRVNPVLYEPETFYPKFAAMLLKFVLRGRVKPGTQAVLIYTDTLPFTGKRAKAVEVTVKSACKSELARRIPFYVLHHRRESNAWIQVADCCCWSVCRKWEHGVTHEYNTIRGRIAATEIDPTERGDQTIYY